MPLKEDELYWKKLKEFVDELPQGNEQPNKRAKHDPKDNRKKPAFPKITFSKGIMIFACAVYAATWLAAVISWFLLGILPDSLLGFGTGAFGVALTVYGTKSGFENCAKIDLSRSDNMG